MRSIALLLTLILQAAIAVPQSGWTAPRLLNPNAGTQGAPFIAIGPNNVLAITCGEYPTPTGSNIRIAVYRSTDRGQTFSRSLVPLPTLPYLSMGPSGISFDRNGNLFVLWAWSEDNFPFYTSNLVLSKSTDGGVTYTTFWQTRQPLFWLSETQLLIDRNNTVHLMWDSTAGDSQFVLLYSKFVNGSPSNLITHVVPPPPTNGDNIRSASLLISQDTLHFAARTSVGLYTRSTDGGATFSSYLLIDSLLRNTRVISTTNGKAIFYGRHPDAFHNGIPILRFIVDSSGSLSEPFLLSTKPVGLSFAGDGGGGASQNRRNYLAYTGADSVFVSSYYEFTDPAGFPTDSAFFPRFIQTTFAIDSLCGKFLVATSYPGENRIYLMTKDVITSVEQVHAEPSSPNTMSVSTNELQTRAIITLRIEPAVDGSLNLYDILGREVSVVHIGSFKSGENRFTLNILNLASGTYFAMFKSSLETITSKFILLH